MKEYCTLVTHDVGNWHADVRFSVRVPGTVGDVMEGRLQSLVDAGWEVIDASCIPQLSTNSHDEPRFAFVLEREEP